MKIVFFTGAGISRESGIKTFRDSDGLWANEKVEDICSTGAWKNNPEKVLKFYNERRKEIRKARPNAAHISIAKLQDKHEVLVVTQNIDDLHERAGSKAVTHLHGEIFKCRPVDNYNLLPCPGEIELGHLHYNGSQLRPHVVFFGEMPWHFAEACTEVSRANILIVVGTSLQVHPASRLPNHFKGDTLAIVDPNAEENSIYTNIIREPATIGVTKLIQELNL
jgi:NAD-dependent deacetylase